MLFETHIAQILTYIRGEPNVNLLKTSNSMLSLSFSFNFVSFIHFWGFLDYHPPKWKKKQSLSYFPNLSEIWARNPKEGSGLDLKIWSVDLPIFSICSTYYVSYYTHYIFEQRTYFFREM